MLKILNIKARYGDCFLVRSCDKSVNFLIDCGFKQTYKQEIRKLTDNVDFIILTHVDEDHIYGAIPLIEDYPDKFSFNRLYINTPSSCSVAKRAGNISISQSITLESLLKQKKIPYGSLVQGTNLNIDDKVNLTIISPTKKDIDYFNDQYQEIIDKQLSETPISINAPFETFEVLSKKKDSFKSKSKDFVNTSSIAFILKYKSYKVLFLGDAHPEVVSDYLFSKGYSSSNKCEFDYIKLSHHGSITSISNKLVSIIRCSNFIISTNGGKARSKHPNRETIAKLSVNVDRGKDKLINFFFNYPVPEIICRNGTLATEEEASRYNINLEQKNELVLV